MNASTIGKVTPEWLKTMGRICLSVLGGALIIYIYQLLQGDVSQEINSAGLILFLNSFTARLLFLILGIVLPLRYTKRYISLGVTRTQFFCGMVIAVFAIALMLALFFALAFPLNAWFGTESPSFDYIFRQFLIDSIIFALYYLLGLLVAVGFSCRNFFTASVGLILAYAGLTFSEKIAITDDVLGKAWNSYLSMGYLEPAQEFYLALPFPFYMTIVCLLVVAALLVAYFFTRRIVIKTS